MAREEKADWVDNLPMVLLGIRTAWRSELEASPAELTFGTALHLPGEFVESTGASFTDHDFLKALQEKMNELTPVQTTNHATQRQARVPDSLDSATHVFVRRDAKAPPLTRPYTGPFKVLAKNPKYFELDYNGKKDCISIDRLKTAFLAPERQAEREDPAVVCYGPNEKKIVSENSKSMPTQPLERRGRPSRAVLAERRQQEGARAREKEREREEQTKSTRCGRASRPPDGL